MKKFRKVFITLLAFVFIMHLDAAEESATYYATENINDITSVEDVLISEGEVKKESSNISNENNEPIMTTGNVDETEEKDYTVIIVIAGALMLLGGVTGALINKKSKEETTR